MFEALRLKALEPKNKSLKKVKIYLDIVFISINIHPIASVIYNNLKN